MVWVEAFFGVPGSSLNIDVLKRFVSGRPQENLHLEFKSGDFFNVDKKDELTRSVTAFANSDGGVLIIGIRERKGNNKESYAESIDGVPVDPKHTKETLENILTGSISPKIEPPIQIFRVEYEDNGMKKSVFILEIPKSERAPHMASDKRYYKRHNFKNEPMENYEVVDYIVGRKSPRLTMQLKLDGIARSDTQTLPIEILVANVGKIMAKYVILLMEIRGATVMEPLPNGFIFREQLKEKTSVQFGPAAGIGLPAVILPSPIAHIRWVSLGRLSLQPSSLTDPITIAYQLSHEELPETDGYFLITQQHLQQAYNGQSITFSPTSENVIY